MTDARSVLVIGNIKLTPDADITDAFSVAKKRLSSLGIGTSALSFSVFKKSVDARHRDGIILVISVACQGEMRPLDERELSRISGVYHSVAYPTPVFGQTPIMSSPVVVGAGPAGLFAALLLAEHGYRPTVIERGGDIESRTAAVERLYSKRILDERSNIQFGLGGAGTFSDGKLITRTGDALCQYVLSSFVKFGAPDEIMYQAKPHIGTDILRSVVSAMADKIVALGGKIIYNTTVTDLKVKGGRISSVITDGGEIFTDAVILAVGHSARDTYAMLMDRGFALEAKNFSVGMRIEHLCEDIDTAMYGKYAGHKNLGHAEYTLSCNTKVRGAYTFCMCPGGEVVCASSEQGGLVVNGMSYSKRDGRNSNSAIAVSVFKEDYGGAPASAIEFQRSIERRAFIQGGGDYTAPIITVGDFLSDKLSREPSRIMPTYMNGAVRLARPSDYLPSFVCNGIRDAIVNFDRRIKGFSCPDAILTGAETRTSAPIRIMRDAERLTAFGTDNLYPCGEGAGYAGGITSAAVDGIRCALALMSRFKPMA